MSIQIIKHNKTFDIISHYDKRLNELIQTFNSRFWKPKERIWTLNVEEYDCFMHELSELGIPAEVQLNDHHVEIKKNGNQIDVKFNTFIEEYSLIRALKNSSYDRNQKTLSLPLTEQVPLLNLLKANKIAYKLDSECHKEIPNILNKTITPENKSKERIKFEDKLNHQYSHAIPKMLKRTIRPVFESQEKIKYDDEEIQPKCSKFLDVPDSQPQFIEY